MNFQIREVNMQFKNIREFVDKDTIYISKLEGGMKGHQIIYYCKFHSFSKGIVKGIVMDADPVWAIRPQDKGKLISARITKCFLYGKSQGQVEVWNYCHWFNKEGVVE
jgi:hypothetical protein